MGPTDADMRTFPHHRKPAALPPPSAARRCRRCPDAGTESKGPRGRPQPPSRMVSGALRYGVVRPAHSHHGARPARCCQGSLCGGCETAVTDVIGITADFLVERTTFFGHGWSCTCNRTAIPRPTATAR
ncbi:hypothetical protein GCM10010416_57190 [Streptomyces caniferus]